MGRAELRRAKKIEEKRKTATYNLTRAQLDDMIEEAVSERIKVIKKESTDDAINTALVLTLALPLEVLMNSYWRKTYAKRIPKFTEQVLDYYRKWESGEITMEDLQNDLWEYGGVRLEKTEV